MTDTCACSVVREIEDFLLREAELLDTRDLQGWLRLLDESIDYRVPTRTTREAHSGASPFSSDSYVMLEDFGSLRARVNRFESEHAWSENPPTVTRRFVSNIRTSEADEDGRAPVRSNLLLSWSRDDAQQLVSAERQDVLSRGADGGWRLSSRLVLLDHVTLPLPNLGMFL